jgi:hypothetical protein
MGHSSSAAVHNYGSLHTDMDSNFDMTRTTQPDSTDDDVDDDDYSGSLSHNARCWSSSADDRKRMTGNCSWPCKRMYAAALAESSSRE